MKVKALRIAGEEIKEEDARIVGLRREYGQRIAVVEFADGELQEVPAQFINGGMGW